VLVFDAVEFLLEQSLFIVPFIEVKDFAVSRKQLVRFFKFCLVARDLRVDINSSRNLKFDREHLASVCECPYF
jgi:hypothetical protein